MIVDSNVLNASWVIGVCNILIFADTSGDVDRCSIWINDCVPIAMISAYTFLLNMLGKPYFRTLRLNID
jgi:hypothetical protein